MHFHREYERTALIHTSRLDLQLTAILLYQGLRYHQAKPDAFAIHLGCSEQLSKLLTKRLYLFCCNTLASVGHLDDNLALWAVIAGYKQDEALGRELYRIFDKIVNHLLHPLLVAHQKLRHLLRLTRFKNFLHKFESFTLDLEFKIGEDVVYGLEWTKSA